MSTSRLLTILIRPATALVGRLRYAQKFVVVGIVLLVPLGFVAAAYVQLQRERIAFSVKERQGVAVLSPLIAVVADTAEARHRSAAGVRMAASNRTRVSIGTSRRSTPLSAGTAPSCTPPTIGGPPGNWSTSPGGTDPAGTRRTTPPWRPC